MDFLDRVFIATLATLALAVLVFQRFGISTPKSVKPPAPGRLLTSQLNVPRGNTRRSGACVDIVGTFDPYSAESGEFTGGQPE